ncbi:hypothetical protein ACFQ4O_10290, partial [Methylopila musalis]
MSAAPVVRIAPGPDGVSIWSRNLFQGPVTPELRAFIGRSFVVEDVRGVEIQRRNGFGRIRYGAARDAAALWRRLSRALRGLSEE